MKKSLIAVAVAGLFAAPVAMAEVTLSGAINLGIEYSKSSAGTVGSQSVNKTQLNSNYSHVDLESVDDIGDGNKVIFHYQLIAQPQTTGTDNTNRNSFLGVMGTWGAFKMGTNENVYERFMYTADPLDGAVGPGGNLMILGTPGASEAFQAGQGSCIPGTGTSLGTGGCVGFYRRTDNTIWYESPNWDGISFEVDYTLSADKKVIAGNTLNPTVLSAGVKYQPAEKFFAVFEYVDVAYEQHHDMFGIVAIANANGKTVPVATGSSDTATQVGFGISPIENLHLNWRFEQLKYTADGTGGTNADYKRNAFWSGIKYDLATGYVGFEIGRANDGKLDGNTKSDTGATMIGVGYFHNLSKQSQLQFIYGNTNNKDNGTYTQAAAPGINGGGTINPGSDSQVFHVGLKHTF